MSRNYDDRRALSIALGKRLPCNLSKELESRFIGNKAEIGLIFVQLHNDRNLCVIRLGIGDLNQRDFETFESLIKIYYLFIFILR